MKKLSWFFTLTVLLAWGILLGGCGPSTQSGVHKTYDMKAEATGASTITLNVTLDAETATDTTSGDAPATLDVDSRLTAAWDAAQAQGVEEGVAFLEDVRNWLDKKFAPDNSNTTNPTPQPDPAPEPTPVPEPEPDDNDTTIDGIDTVLHTYPCDGEMTYRDETETVGIPQKVCTFTDYDSCDQIPVTKFVVIWRDSTGNERSLEVPNRCQISMASKELGYGKFRPAHDKEPFKPVTYAPRGFNAVEMDVIGKKGRFHHTTTGSSDGGKSLVLCPGDETKFERCDVGDVNIPFHGRDNGRLIWWNMNEVPEGPIVCQKDGNYYTFPAKDPVQYGDCSTSNDSGGSDKAGWKYSQKVVWEGDPNPNLETKEFSRCWWTDTTGSFSFLQRKFNFDWDGWKNGEPVLVVFDGGLEVPVTKTNKRHYPGAPGHVKWGVPKMNDHPCKHYPSIAAPKDSTPAYAILYYGKK